MFFNISYTVYFGYLVYCVYTKYTICTVTVYKQDIRKGEYFMSETNIMEVLEYQKNDAMSRSKAMNDYISEHYGEIDFMNICNLFHIGYIEGKRAERAKRKKG